MTKLTLHYCPGTCSFVPMLALELAAFLLIGWLLPALIPLLPAAACLLMSLTIEPVFRPYHPQTGNTSIDEWYNE